MADPVTTVVAQEAVKSLFEVIGRYINYTKRYKRNIDNLKEELKKINDSEVTISSEVRRAKNNAEDIRQDVLGWQQKFEELKSQADGFLNNPPDFHVNCLCCRFPNLRSRYLASGEATEIASMITRHREEGKFDKVGMEPLLIQLPHLSPGEFYGFGSRILIMKEVMDGLKNDSVFVIGACGMGGIGKTTLAKKIADKVKDEKLFDEVVFVVVSQDQNIKAIQDQLASRLSLKAIANEVDIQGRAQLIYKRLMHDEKKILIILDDMWEELDLRLAGIPVHGDRVGLKILLTSRFDNVCTDMKVHKRLEVGVLSKEEAWNLFKMTAQISDDSIMQIAQEVLQECAGLPLAIVTVGKSLRNKKEHAFRDVLRMLRNPCGSNTSKIHDVLYRCIKSSFDYLESDEHRTLLLLCSIFPEDYEIPVEDLVRYSRGLFDTFESMTEARDRVETIVDELLKCYLLLFGERRKCVKLHDVVRDVCLSIATESGDVHVSLKFENLPNKLSGLKFQRLRLLRLVNEEDFWKSDFDFSPKNLEMIFTDEMDGLRVVEVNAINISLPPSIPFMKNLQTLSLDYCVLKGDLAGIGILKMLRVLSFFQSSIAMFPTEIAELTNLQCLDLRFRKEDSATFPFKTLSSLKELEELYLGDISSGDIESLKEVSSFSKLRTIQFKVEDDILLEVLLKLLNRSELIRFDIACGRKDGSQMFSLYQPRNDYQFDYQIKENSLVLQQHTGHINLNLLKPLKERVKLFDLNGDGLTNVVEVLGEASGFQNLIEFESHDCDMKYLVDASNHPEKGVFRKLETLQIRDASQLEELIHGNYSTGILNGQHEVNQGNFHRRSNFQYPFGNLRRLEISHCVKLRSLFSKSMVNNLKKLEFILIEYCPVLERMVGIQKEGEVDCSEVSQLPKLKQLKLYGLPGFRSLMDSFNEDLEMITVSKCSSLEVVFNFEEIEETALPGRLESVDLFDLPKLEHVWSMVPGKGAHVFRNLKNLEVRQCSRLRYLLTPAMTIMLVHLEHIRLIENELMESIIGKEEIVPPKDEQQIMLESLMLPKLKSLFIERLPSFRKLCSSVEFTLDLPSLSKLDITCKVEDIFTKDQTSHLTSLSIGRIGDRRYLFTPSSIELLLGVQDLELRCGDQTEAILGSDKIDGEDATKKSFTFPQLRTLKIYQLRNLRKLCLSPDLNLQLPSLTELRISDSPVDILTRETHGLQNLTKIKVESCDSFKYLPTSSAEVLVHLEELVLTWNASMEAVFGYENTNAEDIPRKTIVLPQLRRLEISGPPNFRMLCSSLNLHVDLPSLTQLHIYGCQKMSKLCAGQLSAPQLINVKYFDEEVNIGTFINSWLKDCESMTRCLECTYYGRETCSHFVYQDSDSEESYSDSETDGDLEHQNSESEDCESMTRCLECTSDGNETCSHLGYQDPDSEESSYSGSETCGDLDYRNSESEMEQNEENVVKMIASNGEGCSTNTTSKPEESPYDEAK